MTSNRRRAIAFIGLVLGWWLVYLLVVPPACNRAAAPLLDMHLTMTAFATTHPCPPNCDMIPTAEGTPDNPWWQYHCYLPMIRSK